MTRMGAGDSGALFVFVDAYRSELTATVRMILGSVGRRDAAASAADLEFLVLSAALVVHDRAGKWRPGGAPPWVWAIRGIRAEIVRWLGHPRVEFRAELHAPLARASVVAAREVSLETLAGSVPELAAHVRAVGEVASERDRSIHLEYQTQKLLGDPSPANTVAAEFGVRPDNVRQIDARVRRRLRQLSATL